jgi:hypothetical protein
MIGAHSAAQAARRIAGILWSYADSTPDLLHAISDRHIQLGT